MTGYEAGGKGREGRKEGQTKTYLVKHEEFGVALPQIVLVTAHLDVHVVDGVPVRVWSWVGACV